MRTASKDFGDVRVVVTRMDCAGVPVIEDRHVHRKHEQVRWYPDPVALLALRPVVRNRWAGRTYHRRDVLERDMVELYRYLQQA